MALTGVHVLDENKCKPHIDHLPKDHITRYKAVPRTVMVTGAKPEDKWLVIADDYPAQMAERLRLLNERADYYIDRLPGPEVAAAEIELRDRVVAYLTKTYPDYFYRNGNSVVCRLSGISVRLDEADPLVAIGVLAAEDFCLMMPSDMPDITGEKNYRLSSGVLVQPSGWSLASKFDTSKPFAIADLHTSFENARLGKTSYEIHVARVAHYAKNFAPKVETYFKRMEPDIRFWRRNWGPYRTGQLSLHPDLPRPEPDLQTPQDWRDHGYIRSEHEGLVKLWKDGPVAFSIRTFLWKVSDIEKNPEALAALIKAYDNLSPEMYDYRRDRLESFGKYLDAVCPADIQAERVKARFFAQGSYDPNKPVELTPLQKRMQDGSPDTPLPALPSGKMDMPEPSSG